MTRERGIAFAAVAAALAVAAGYAPVDLLHTWRDVRNAHAQPRARRAELVALSVGIQEPRPIERAAALIPPGATYAVVTGPAARVRGRTSVDYVKFWAQYVLLPRRATNPREAQWLLGYGADLRAAGLPLVRVHDLGGGVTVAEVAR